MFTRNLRIFFTVDENCSARTFVFYLSFADNSTPVPVAFSQFTAGTAPIPCGLAGARNTVQFFVLVLILASACGFSNKLPELRQIIQQFVLIIFRPAVMKAGNETRTARKATQKNIEQFKRDLVKFYYKND